MTLLDVQSLDAFYGDFQALFGVDFSLGEGETVAIIGSNGAGKSTFLRALTGLVASNAQKLAYRSASIANMADRVITLSDGVISGEHRNSERQDPNTLSW